MGEVSKKTEKSRTVLGFLTLVAVSTLRKGMQRVNHNGRESQL